MMFGKNAFYAVGLMVLMGCSTQNGNTQLFAKNTKLEKASTNYTFTEGPAVDKEGNVYFTDQPNDKIYKWDWTTNQVSLFSDNTGRANGTYFNSKDELITCSDNLGEMWKFNKKGEKLETLITDFNGKRLNGPNDLWIDSKDGIYFTDPLYVREYWTNFKQEIPQKNLYFRNTDGKIQVLDQFTQPNGIIGSNTLKKLYVSDIDANKTYVYDIVGEGKLANKKLFCELGSDGMTLDNKGNLYLTGKGVFVYNPQGVQILHIPIDEEEWTSNVTFGGKNRDILFVTTTTSVYTIKMNVKAIN